MNMLELYKYIYKILKKFYYTPPEESTDMHFNLHFSLFFSSELKSHEHSL